MKGLLALGGSRRDKKKGIYLISWAQISKSMLCKEKNYFLDTKGILGAVFQVACMDRISEKATNCIFC